MPSKLFESSCAKYSIMVIPTKSYSSEASKFFFMVQPVISNATSFGFLEFVPYFNIPPFVG